MTGKNTILPLAFPEHFSKGYARLGQIELFEADPVKWKFSHNDPDDAELLDWLNANTPGWRLTITPGPVENVELPVGCEPVVTMQNYTIDVHFATSAHREAFRRRRKAIQDEHEALNAHIERQKAAAAPGVEICRECGAPMQPATYTETPRIAQFAFRYTLDILQCPGCKCSSHTFAGGLKAVVDADADITARVGLPIYGDPLWTDAIGDEWKRRRKAAPEILIEVGPDCTPEALIAELDARIAASGRPPRTGLPSLQPAR